jgi:hypothetical protein
MTLHPYLKKAILLALFLVCLNVILGVIFGISKNMWSHKTTKNIDKGILIANAITFVVVFCLVMWNFATYILNKK